MDEAINRSVCTIPQVDMDQEICTWDGNEKIGIYWLRWFGGSVRSRFAILVVLLALKETEIK